MSLLLVQRSSTAAEDVEHVMVSLDGGALEVIQANGCLNEGLCSGARRGVEEYTPPNQHGSRERPLSRLLTSDRSMYIHTDNMFELCICIFTHSRLLWICPGPL